MRYRRAVEKLRLLAQACDEAQNWPLDEQFLLEAYVFGEVLDGADPIENVKVALVLNVAPEDVPWESQPDGTTWLVEQLRLDKGGYLYFWRSHLDPVWNHYIRGPVRFWSLAGPDDAVLTALSERRFADLHRLTPDPEVEREQIAADLDVALGHLRAVHRAYWERDWRREHSRFGRYPEHELWEAVEGYLDLRDALLGTPGASKPVKS